MIEYLSIAAEIVAVLLICSISFPITAARSGRDGTASARDKHGLNVDLIHETPVNELLALHQLRLLAYTSPSQHSIAISDDSNGSEQFAVSAFRQCNAMFSANWLDLTTRLPTIGLLVRFLEANRELRTAKKITCHLVLLRITDWPEKKQQFTSATRDQYISSVADRLENLFAAHGLVTRSGECDFVIALIGKSLRQSLELLHRGLSSRAISSANDEGAHSDTSQHLAAALIDFDSENNPASLDADQSSQWMDSVDMHWGMLEEGISHASSANTSKFAWYDRPSESWKVGIALASEIGSCDEITVPAINGLSQNPSTIQMNDVAAASTAASRDVTAKKSIDQSNPSSAIRNASAVQSDIDLPARAPLAAALQSDSDNAGVTMEASVDDIDSLFAVAKTKIEEEKTEQSEFTSNENKTENSPSEPPSENDPSANSTMAEITIVETSKNSVAGKGSEEATPNSSGEPDQLKKSQTDQVPPAPAKAEAKAAAEDTVSDAATSDEDIEALFAAAYSRYKQ